MTRPTRIGRSIHVATGNPIGGISGQAEGQPPPVPQPPAPEDQPDRAASESGTVAVTWQEVAGPPDDLNLAHGTVSDGGGSKTFTNPTHANDDDGVSNATIGPYVSTGGPDIGYLVADLGSARTVHESVVYGDVECASDPTSGLWTLQASNDGSTWSDVACTEVWSGVGGGPPPSGGHVTYTLDTPESHRYWRIRADLTPSGFNCGVDINTWQLNGPDTVAIAWNELAVRTNDGDDSTYHEIDGPDVLRLDLGAEYAIGRLRLRIATETSGSRTYTLYGANLPDFSDAVEVTSFGFSATGSFTAQTVAHDWTPDASYRFWQLSGDDETRRIHSFELYEALPATGGGVTDHGALTGLGDDDHPQYLTEAEADALYEPLGGGGGGSLTVKDATTTVTDVDTIVFDGATVTDDGGGQATVELTGGGGGGDDFAIDCKGFAIFPFASTNAASITITARAAGERILLVVATRNNDVTSVSCTNVTWTEAKGWNSGTSTYLSVYVGVVSGGSSGTTITVNVGGTNFVFASVVYLGNALTPTTGNDDSYTGTVATGRKKPLTIATTPGELFVMAYATNDASSAVSQMETSSPSFWVPDDSLCGLHVRVGVAGSDHVTGWYDGGNSTVAVGLVGIS